MHQCSDAGRDKITQLLVLLVVTSLCTLRITSSGESIVLYSVYQTQWSCVTGAKWNVMNDLEAKRTLDASKGKKSRSTCDGQPSAGGKRYRTAVWLQPSRSAAWSRRHPV
jgi:hypothetical protein